MKADKYGQTWFEFDWYQNLVVNNKTDNDATSNHIQTPEQKEAIAQYQPNSTLIPLLLLGIPPNPIYQFRPIAEDDYDGDNVDVDNMPEHLADGNDPLDYHEMAQKSKQNVSDAMSELEALKKKFRDVNNVKQKDVEPLANKPVEKTTA
jgi:hypothetical protein